MYKKKERDRAASRSTAIPSAAAPPPRAVRRRNNYSSHAITNGARPCRAGAATVSLHQLRPPLAALIAASRFKTMIYLIKPHFCIVSRAFVVIRPAIISARPLHPPARNSDRHDHDSPSLTPFPFPFSLPSRTDCSPRSFLPRRALFSFFLSPFFAPSFFFLFFFFFFRQSRVMAPTSAEGGRGEGRRKVSRKTARAEVALSIARKRKYVP